MSRNILILWTLLVCAGIASARPSGPATTPPDASQRPVYSWSYASVESSRFGSYRESDTSEIEGDWELAYVRDIGRADMDLGLRLRGFFFSDLSGTGLPSRVMQIALDSGWTWRKPAGAGLQVRLAPGIYSNFEEWQPSAFSMPFSIAATGSLRPGLSGIAGLQLRPGFDQAFMPLIGVDWAASPDLHVKAQLPESRVLYFITSQWSAHLGFEWRNMTFRISQENDSDLNRDTVTLNDYQLFAGTEYEFAGGLRLSVEAGSLFGRSLRFEESGPIAEEEVDVDSGLFARLGLSCFY